LVALQPRQQRGAAGVHGTAHPLRVRRFLRTAAFILRLRRSDGFS
jgi:hypothetical protein